MIVLQSGTRVVDAGYREARHCTSCQGERPHALLLEYKWASIYWVFGKVEAKRYLMLCEICQRGAELNTRDVERQIDRVPIPFMQRFGCLTFVLLVGGAIAISVMRDMMNPKNWRKHAAMSQGQGQVVTNLRVAKTLHLGTNSQSTNL